MTASFIDVFFFCPDGAYFVKSFSELATFKNKILSKRVKLRSVLLFLSMFVLRSHFPFYM